MASTPHHQDTDKPVWLITGCSAGLGLALARHVALQGHRVIATSRSPSKTPEIVAELEGLGVVWKALDVTDAKLEDSVNEAVKVYGRVDILVNNAGFSILGALEQFTYPLQVLSQFSTNVFGTLHLTQLVLPVMRARKSGTIVNISSIAGLDPLPSSSLYAASKHALEGISEGLSRELKPYNVRVLIVEPGAFRTNFLTVQGSGTTTTEAGSSSTGGGSVFLEPHEAYRAGLGTGVGETMERFGQLNGAQAGSVEKAVKAMFEAVTGTGELGEVVVREGLLRLLLGEDALRRAQGKINELQRSLDVVKPWASKMGMDD